jgi:hypothetical protein
MAQRVGRHRICRRVAPAGLADHQLAALVWMGVAVVVDMKLARVALVGLALAMSKPST